MKLLLFLLAVFMGLILFSLSVQSAEPPAMGYEIYCEQDTPCPESDYTVLGFQQTELTVQFDYYPQNSYRGATQEVEDGVLDWGRFTISATNTSFTIGEGIPHHNCIDGVQDGKNSIVWAELPGNAIGRACWWTGTNEADIVLDNTWAGFSEPGSIRTVTLHEVGHGLGLGHSEVNAAVMYFSYKGPQQLHEDDIQGFCSLYRCGLEEPTATPTNSPTPTPTPPPLSFRKFIPFVSRD